jgi:hypothetical protein
MTSEETQSRYGVRLREMGVEHFDEGDELPEEYRDLLREVVRVQVDVEGVLLYHDWIKGWLDVAPTPRDRMRIAKLHAEELVHGYHFLKMYKQVDRELTAADFEDDDGRKAQYIFSYSFDTWTDIALLNTLADRMGAFIFHDMTDCSYLPWRRLSARIARTSGATRRSVSRTSGTSAKTRAARPKLSNCCTSGTRPPSTCSAGPSPPASGTTWSGG